MLASLEYAAFLRCVARLLVALGYEEVRFAGRIRSKGRNRDGGYDLEAWAGSGLGRRRVIVQAKQFGPGTRVFRRSADELRGTALRAGAAEAILITTGTFSRLLSSSRKADGDRQANPLIPVLHLIDGDRLADLLVRYGAMPHAPAGETTTQGAGKPAAVVTIRVAVEPGCGSRPPRGVSPR